MEDDHQTAKSPQEKKALSYAKDRRNGFGENAKASRKAIPRRKAVENRGNRRNVAQALSTIGRLDDVAEALVESSVQHGLERVGGWTKVPDVSLSDHLSKRDRCLISIDTTADQDTSAVEP